jgi:ADP-L-glycero-D-manno-heptose 6-epimerase
VPAPPYLIVTGAAGFIGSALVSRLNRRGHHRLVLVDDFDRPEKQRNLEGKRFALTIARPEFPDWLAKHASEVDLVFHLGARTDTTEFDRSIFDRLNVAYSQELWNICSREGIALVYASSAATYGDGHLGYSDDHAGIPALQPLNPYGDSKQAFDCWVLNQTACPPLWAGLKFFNVYGPNEYHKGRMASVVFHATRQIRESGNVKLFRSHKEGIADGEQKRDFIYVRDVVDVLEWFVDHRAHSGIFNLGTGQARTFLDLAKAVFRALDQPENIVFIDMPEDIRETYQYFTEAGMSKLRAAGYAAPFRSLEDGISDYVRNYLTQERIY